VTGHSFDERDVIDALDDVPARQPDHQLTDLRLQAISGSVTAVDAILAELAAREQQLQERTEQRDRVGKLAADATIEQNKAEQRADEAEQQLTRLREAVTQAMPALENALAAFLDPPSYSDSSLNAYRFEALASGTHRAIENLNKALAITREKGTT
jgi:hypothetical protein